MRSAVLMGFVVLVLSGCGSRPPAARVSPSSATPGYAEAVDSLLLGVDSVSVEGTVYTEDRSPLADPVMVRAHSSVLIERRRIGGGWELDESLQLDYADSAMVGRDGQYRLRIPAVVETELLRELAFRDPREGTGFVRFADNPGIQLEGEGGGASAKDLVVQDPSPSNRLDFTLRHTPVRLTVITENTMVRGEPRAAADTLYTLGFGATVNQIRAEGDWSRVRYSAGLYGWVPVAQLGDSDALAAARAARDKVWSRQVDRLHRSAKIAGALKERRVIEGMTPKDVELLWGKADHTEEFKEGKVARERWLYAPRSDRGSRQVVFERGVVLQVIQD